MLDISARKDTVRNQKMPQFLTARGDAEYTTNGHRFAVKAELINEAISAFLVQLYEVDEQGKFLNLDKDGRIRLRVPWRKEWNDKQTDPALRDTERTAVRMILETYQSSLQYSHLFEFIPPSWHIRIARFPDLQSALKWLDNAKINATLYNAVDTKRRTKRRDT